MTEDFETAKYAPSVDYSNERDTMPASNYYEQWSKDALIREALLLVAKVPYNSEIRSDASFLIRQGWNTDLNTMTKKDALRWIVFLNERGIK